MRRLLAIVWVLISIGGTACLGVADEVSVDSALTAGAPRSTPALGSTDAGGAIAFDAGAPVDPCASFVCTHGTCDATSGAAACRCDTGFHSADAGVCVIDDPCAGVTCGANATCSAGACACDTNYEGDAKAGCTLTPNAHETQVRDGLITIAEAELGNCEGSVVRPYMLQQPGLWCYDFVAWVYAQSPDNLPSPLSNPRVYPASAPAGWKPARGDLIKYTYQHYGMIDTVSADGKSFTTIEGNVSGCVMRRGGTVADLEYVGSLASHF